MLTLEAGKTINFAARMRIREICLHGKYSSVIFHFSDNNNVMSYLDKLVFEIYKSTYQKYELIKYLTLLFSLAEYSYSEIVQNASL